MTTSSTNFSIQYFLETIEEYALARPDVPACSSESKVLTYGSLQQVSGQLSDMLSILPVVDGIRVVGIFTGNRSVDFLCGVIGSLKAGFTFVALDTQSSDEVLKDIIAHSTANIIVTNDLCLSRAESLIGQDKITHTLINLDGLSGPPVPYSRALDNGRAAIYYTSGSTGKPKGILHSAESLLQPALVEQTPLISPGMQVAVTLAASFGASRAALLRSLYCGAEMHWWDPAILGGQSFLNEIRNNKIEVLYSGIGLLRSILPGAQHKHYPDLKYLVLGGEKVYWRDIQQVKKYLGEHVHVVSRYGATEAGLISDYEVDTIPDDVSGLLPAGKVVPGIRLKIVDGKDNRLAKGETGEIIIEGSALSLGYWAESDTVSTAFSFASDDPGLRCYRTGDQGRLSENQTLMVFGRTDEQVKIRGFRVNLGAIETTIREIPSVTDCCVMAAEDTTGNMICQAFYTLKDEAVIEVGAIREWLRMKLPYYMVPDLLQEVLIIPLTSSGKPDREQLQLLIESSEPVDTSYWSDREQRLAGLWQHHLGIPVGLDDNFFDLGGSSLRALELALDIEQSFGKKLDLSVFFRTPTIRLMARDMEKASGLKDDEHHILVPLRVLGPDRPSLFLIHPQGGTVFCYQQLASLIDPEINVYGLQAQGIDRDMPLHTTIEEMAECYIERVLQLAASEHCYLCGYSSGGMVAFEMAQRLHARGNPARSLILIDTPFNVRQPGTQISLLKRLHRLTSRLFTSRSIPKMKLQVQEMLRQGRFWRTWKKRYGKLNPQDDHRRLLDTLYDNYSEQGQQQPDLFRHIRNIQQLATQFYCPNIYPELLCYIQAVEKSESIGRDYGWWRVAGAGERYLVVDGSHNDLLKDGTVKLLAEALNEEIHRSEP